MDEDQGVWLADSRGRCQLLHVDLVDEEVAAEGGIENVVATNVKEVAAMEGFVAGAFGVDYIFGRAVGWW